MIGAGYQPAGTSSAGIGIVDPVVPEVEPDSGALYLGADGDYFIDPETHDLARMPEVVQKVVIALCTQLGSASANVNLGVLDPVKMDSRFEAACRNSVMAALRPMLEAREIRVDSVTVKRVNSQRVYRRVVFFDLKRNRTERVQVRLV